MLGRFAFYVLNYVVSVLRFDDDALAGIRVANPAVARGFYTMFEALWASVSG